MAIVMFPVCRRLMNDLLRLGDEVAYRALGAGPNGTMPIRMRWFRSRLLSRLVC